MHAYNNCYTIDTDESWCNSVWLRNKGHCWISFGIINKTSSRINIIRNLEICFYDNKNFYAFYKASFYNIYEKCMEYTKKEFNENTNWV